MKNKQLILGIIIGIIITGLIVGLYFGYQYQKNKYLQEGYNQGVLYSYQTGNFAYLDNNATIKTITIQQLCSQVNGGSG